jgi:hypothetical protein
MAKLLDDMLFNPDPEKYKPNHYGKEIPELQPLLVALLQPGPTQRPSSAVEVMKLPFVRQASVDVQLRWQTDMCC